MTFISAFEPERPIHSKTAAMASTPSALVRKKLPIGIQTFAKIRGPTFTMLTRPASLSRAVAGFFGYACTKYPFPHVWGTFVAINSIALNAAARSRNATAFCRQAVTDFAAGAADCRIVGRAYA